jgi:aminoglycoside 3-N-acetyltransferase I
MQVTVSKVSENEIDRIKQMLSVFEDVFEMESFVVPDDNYLYKLLQNPDIIFMVAEVDGKVVGGLTAYVLPQYYSQCKHAYIHDVAISTSYQRKGIGRELIVFFNNYCKSMGFEEVFVAAETEDEHALAFYRSTGGEAMESVHFFYKLNNIQK